MRTIFQFADPIRMVEGRHGFMVYNQYCRWVGQALEMYGEYCEHEITLFGQVLKPNDVVWEIGANTGSQSVALARFVPQGRYIGFEPQLELYKILVTNLTLNNCENALPLHLALGEVDGFVDIPPVNYHQPNNFGGMSLLEEQHGNQGKVKMRTIDSLSKLSPPNFIKIDVEGMESGRSHESYIRPRSWAR
jgi:FkbM family methyltransferase